MEYTNTLVDWQGNETMLPSNNKNSNSTGANANTEEEVSKEAQKEADDKAKDSMTGVLQLIPHANYRAKQVWYLSGFSQVFDGNYYFKQVTHKINVDRGYSVTARVVKNELGGEKQEDSERRREVAGLNNAGSWV